MLRHVKSGMLLLSIAYLLLGLWLLVMPQTSLRWICYAFGAVVLLTGVVCLVRYARARGNGFLTPLWLIGGIITGALGVFTLAQPDYVASILPVVFGLFIVFDGLSRILSGFGLLKQRGRKWWTLVLLGLVSVGLGVFLIARPLDLLVSVVMLCGVLLVLEGAMNLACIIYTAMELHTLERLAQSALNASLAAAGDALDEEDEAPQTTDAVAIVYEAQSTEVPSPDPPQLES